MTDDHEDKLAQPWYDPYSSAIVDVLGEEHDIVMHAIIPYAVGGGLDLYAGEKNLCAALRHGKFIVLDSNLEAQEERDLPKLKSSKKRLRQAHKAAVRNKPVRTLFRTTIKRVRSAESKEAAESMLPQANAVIDRTARKGVIHARTAARFKSRLAKHVAAMS